ncbi:MAG TPA: phosphate ABC transporter ATP-binding protein [Thermodesulfobacteriota bacterium]|nr:phosphate ABC transporter ATP-binding protein [Thermodesulfobacteriota bacterium]
MTFQLETTYSRVLEGVRQVPGPAVSTFDIHDLSVAFNGRSVLRKVNAIALDRHVLAIIGPSGSGKSTLLRTMNRTLELTPDARVTSGDVLFKGERLYGNGTDARLVRKRICMVHQKPVAFPMSIAENVLFGVRFHKNWNGRRKDEIIQNCLENAGLWDEVKDRVSEPASRLSVGQLQRLCIARALANDPEALLMDEPCSALDPVSTARVEELIVALKRQLPVVIVTHNLAQARRISDQSLFLYDGQSLEQDVTERIFTDPRNGRVHDFITGKVG